MSAPQPRLYAVTPEGPARAEAPPGAETVHELFDAFPLAVYSGLRTWRHDRFLRLDLHLARTRECLQLAGWPGFDEALLRRALQETCGAWPGADARVRFDVLSEPGRIGALSSRVWIALSELVLPSAAMMRDGVRVELSHELARERPRIKLTDFVIRRRPWPINTPERYELVMVAPDGRLLEGTTSNFWAVQDGVLRTAGRDVLQGVTQRILLELAAELCLPVRLEAVREDQLGALEEAFVSSSTRALVPVVRIGDARVGDGRPGPVARRLFEAYAAYAEREARPAVEAPAGADA